MPKMQIQDIIVKLSEALTQADWDDPLSTIGLLQALYRLLAFGNKDYYVLHASAALTPKGSAVAFGDNGVDTRGKTICALELAAASGKFIVDEFVLYRRGDGHIFANPVRPIHFKGNTYQHLREVHGIIEVPDQKLVDSRKLFTIVSDVPLAALVIPNLGTPQSSIEKLKGKDKTQVVKATAYGHLTKLLHPELDRSSILTKSDTSKPVDIRATLEEFPPAKIPVPVFRVDLKEPGDVVDLLGTVNL